MERLDFASVMAVLRRNIPDENVGNQADFLESLFLDLGFNPQTAAEFYSRPAADMKTTSPRR